MTKLYIFFGRYTDHEGISKSIWCICAYKGCAIAGDLKCWLEEIACREVFKKGVLSLGQVPPAVKLFAETAVKVIDGFLSQLEKQEIRCLLIPRKEYTSNSGRHGITLNLPKAFYDPDIYVFEELYSISTEKARRLSDLLTTAVDTWLSQKGGRGGYVPRFIAWYVTKGYYYAILCRPLRRVPLAVIDIERAFVAGKVNPALFRRYIEISWVSF